MCYAIVIMKLENFELVESPVSLLTAKSLEEAEFVLGAAAARLGFPHRMSEPDEHPAFYTTGEGEALVLESVETEHSPRGLIQIT